MFSVGFPSSLTRQQIIQKLSDGETILIAWVDNHHHFVLVTGYDTANDDIYYVNDSYYNNTFYTFEDIVGYIEFKFEFKPTLLD